MCATGASAAARARPRSLPHGCFADWRPCGVPGQRKMDGGVLDGYAAIFFHLAGSIRCRPGLAQEIVMNPFLHNPVALAPAGASVRAPAVGASLDRALARDAAAGRGAGRRWGRRLGMLALAAGMSLTAASAAAMDVNSATAEQLQSLRGVGPKTAAIIIHERQRGGNFQSMEDLSDRVRGIGAKKARDLVDYLELVSGEDGGQINSLAQLRTVPGLGGKTVERAYAGLVA